jgi:hypothetical protein
MLRKIMLVAVIAAVSLPVAGFARDKRHETQGQAVPQSQDAIDRAACSGDSHRYCRAMLGDDMSVLSCLQTNRAKLTRACRGVLERNGV